MSYRLVSSRELYKENIPNVMRPFTAKRILQNTFCCSQTTIFNLNKFVSPFGNKEIQQKKLIQDIENGRVMLVAMAREFGTLGAANTSYNGTGEFNSSIQQIRQYGKKRSTMGGSFHVQDEDNDFSTLEFVAGATIGVASAVGDEIRNTLEFAADLAGSAVYDYTGFKGAKAAHQRTEKRVDALIEQTKHLDELLDDLGHVITHPSETYNAIKNKANEQLDTYDDLIDSGKNYQAGLLAGAVVKEVGEALLDTPLTKVKNLAKLRNTFNKLPLSHKVASKPVDLDPIPLTGYKGRLSELRSKPGVASTGGELPRIHEGNHWIRGSQGNAAKIPAQVADKLAGKEFPNFDAFRKAFWKEVGADPVLLKEFSPGNKSLIKKGKAPAALPTQQVGDRKKYELDHVIEIQNGGGVYDMDNITIRTPLNHIKGK